MFPAEAFACIAGMEESFKMATEVAGMTQPLNPPADSSMICTQDLWKTYDMGSEQQVHALRGVNLSIHQNEYVAIMGPSGSGKSTLMNLIGCLDTPTQGEYWLNGQLVSELNDDELAAVWQAGFPQTLAALGTHLNSVQLTQLSSCSSR